MDEGVGEDLLPLDSSDGNGHIQGKDNEYYHHHHQRPETRNVLESHEMRLPPIQRDYSTNEFREIFDGGNSRGLHDVNPLEHPYNITRSSNDSGSSGAVEELTVKKLSGSGLTIVGTSNGSIRVQGRNQSQWQHLYQLGGNSSRVNTDTRDNKNTNNNGQRVEDLGYSSFPEFLAQKAVDENPSEVGQPLTNPNGKGISGKASGSVRTKILSKSGFSEFFVKNTLKGKGIVFKGPPQTANPIKPSEPSNNTKLPSKNPGQTDTSAPKEAKIVNPRSNPNGAGGNCTNGGNGCGEVNLREWLKDGHSRTSKTVRLCIFRQIVEIVDYSHSQGLVLHRLRPSYFELLPSYKVRYIGSPDKSEILQSMMNRDSSQLESHSRKRPVEQKFSPSASSSAKKQRHIQNTGAHNRQWLQLSVQSSFGQQSTVNELDEANLVSQNGTESKFGIARENVMSARERLEEKWYTSPEEPRGESCTLFTNIYCLGVFLFELLAHFDSDSALVTAMSDLHHRILPPNFLSENPKEAGFCLWLLHPEPSSRPSTREIMQSDVVNGLPEACTENIVASIDEEDIESDILMHFLGSLKENKQKDASKLVDAIKCLEADIKEIEKRNCTSSQSKSFRGESSSDALPRPSTVLNTNKPKLTKNFDKFENAYFSMRTDLQTPMTNTTIRQDNELLRARENLHISNRDEERQVPKDRVGAFFDGLCKYARHSRFEVRGVLRNGEFNSAANVICSLSFDRDEDYFAAAGVSKKIKIYDFNSLLNDSVDIHYPAIEMPNRSKLSGVCWNGYIKNYLASSDYDGSVKLWDASTGQAFSQYNEHEKRAWSVDFSKVYPTKLASGSDDCTVKLWNINEKNSLGTIRNVANVCCVQFSAHSTYLLAFGSADYRTYCYDLRYARTPWCVLSGHEKAVSYVKFLDSETIVSASTDNTLKLWDLNKSTPNGSPSACTSTLKGHTNEKNFVGLSVADGYIACGSESNEVYAYYRSLPMPITSHKFGSIDSITGKETEDDNGQFVSSVCWRAKSEMVVAANSTGCIKVLQMI